MSHDKLDSNPWLSSSDLAINGRAVAVNESEMGAPTVKLPRGQELLLPENGSPDHDLRMSERLKPSPEQAAAQKGGSASRNYVDVPLQGHEVAGAHHHLQPYWLCRRVCGCCALAPVDDVLLVSISEAQ